MIEILVLVVCVLLAKRTPKRRRRFNLRRIRVTPERDLGTLGSDTVIVNALSGVAVSTYRCVTAKGTWALTGLTLAEGPITVGFAHDDYSVVEIKEALEAATAVDQGNKIAQEQANRLVRIVGTMSEANAMLNDGKPISTKLNWLIGIGHAINMFAYNESSSALTTGASIRFTGDMWVKDSA